MDIVPDDYKVIQYLVLVVILFVPHHIDFSSPYLQSSQTPKKVFPTAISLINTFGIHSQRYRIQFSPNRVPYSEHGIVVSGQRRGH